MNNIHLISTDKPSRLIKNNLGYGIVSDAWKQFDIDLIQAQYQNIYITNDEEIKEGDWYFLESVTTKNMVLKANESKISTNCKKIILTTDQDLIKDGVQAIDDEFLEWFVKNPSCEEVDVLKIMSIRKYKIIIPSQMGTLKEKLMKVSNIISKNRHSNANYIELSEKYIQQLADERKISFDDMVEIIRKELIFNE
jgi:hypothetical protein